MHTLFVQQSGVRWTAATQELGLGEV